jgi:hypothetical protein
VIRCAFASTQIGSRRGAPSRRATISLLGRETADQPGATMLVAGAAVVRAGSVWNASTGRALGSLRSAAKRAKGEAT